jgi:hypothetical protein
MNHRTGFATFASSLRPWREIRYPSVNVSFNEWASKFEA